MLRAALVPAWCVLVAVAAAQLPRLSFDNDTWLAPHNPQRLELEHFRKEFEPHEALLVVLELPTDFFAPQQTRAIERLDTALAALPQTHSVLSPLSATTIINDGEALEIGSFSEALRRGFIADADQYRERFTTSPYAGKLLSEDGRHVLLRVALAREGAASRTTAVAAVAETVRDHGFAATAHRPQTNVNNDEAAHAGVLYFAGESALKNALNRITREQLPLLLLLAAALLAVFLHVACGNWRRAVLVLSAATAAVAACLGIMAAFAWPMSAVLLVLPVMVAVIAIADGLHILACWDALSALPPADKSAASLRQGTRLGETIRQSWAPCLGATVTSAAGFGAFAISELTPLNHFGAASALTILYAYPLITGALWGGLWLFPSLATASARRLDWARLADRAARLSSGAPRRVIAAALCAALLLGGGLGLLRTETNFLSVFFAEDSAMRQSFDRVDTELGGSGRVEVVVRREADAFATLAGLREVETLAQRFAGIGTVNAAVESYLLPVAMADEAFGGTGVPQSDEALAQELLFLSLSRSDTNRDVLSPYLDFSHGAARLSLQTPNLNSPALRETIDAVAVQAVGAATSGDAPDISITGFGVFIHNLGEQVLRTQIFSILLTLLVIGALLLLQFGWRAGLCGFAANLLPLAATAGLVAWLNYPYDFAVILIAGITLGLSVDDTIHFLHHHRRHRRNNAGAGTGVNADALQHALRRTARPIVITTLLFCCGLAVLAFSELVVLRRFAAFSAFGVGAALACVLLFLPASLVMIFRAQATR